MADQTSGTRTELKTVRELRGLAAAELARAAGVSRQTIYAIEDGSYVPNTAVALRLARALDARVEEIFRLEDQLPNQPDTTDVRATLLTDWKAEEGRCVQLARVYDRLVALPAPSRSACLPLSDGFVVSDRETREAGRKVTVQISRSNEIRWDRRLVIAGCDPALTLLADAARQSGIDLIIVPCSSRQALRWLQEGCVHLAGSHLVDRETGDYNLSTLRRLFPDRTMQAVTFARWQQGLVLRAGNPKSIHAVSDLASARITVVNREKGSGSRDLLDTSLRREGISIDAVAGYDRLAAGHIAAAAAVAQNRADCCIASEAAAINFGLDFIPLEEQRFELCLPEQVLQLKTVSALLDTLQNASLRSRLQQNAGYDCSQTGMVRAVPKRA